MAKFLAADIQPLTNCKFLASTEWEPFQNEMSGLITITKVVQDSDNQACTKHEIINTNPSLEIV